MSIPVSVTHPALGDLLMLNKWMNNQMSEKPYKVLLNFKAKEMADFTAGKSRAFRG